MMIGFPTALGNDTKKQKHRTRPARSEIAMVDTVWRPDGLFNRRADMFMNTA
jgi:hypothetical protein